MSKKNEFEEINRLQEELETFQEMMELTSSIEIPDLDDKEGNYKEAIEETDNLNKEKMKRLKEISFNKLFGDLVVTDLDILFTPNTKNIKEEDAFKKAFVKMSNSKLYKFKKLNADNNDKESLGFKTRNRISLIVLNTKFTKEFERKFNSLVNSIDKYNILKKFVDYEESSFATKEYFRVLTVFLYKLAKEG